MNEIEKYHQWLDTVDPRLKPILIDLDDEMCSGRIGARQRFHGDLEFRLLLIARDGQDFIELMKTAQQHRDPFEIEQHARLVWNVTLNYVTRRMQDFTQSVRTKRS